MNKFEIEFSYYINNDKTKKDSEKLCVRTCEVEENDRVEFINNMIKNIAYKNKLTSGIVVREIKTFKVL